jgi:hypothetical protein
MRCLFAVYMFVFTYVYINAGHYNADIYGTIIINIT